MAKLPELYKKYKCYDDGKISKSRQYDVLITDIVKWECVNLTLKTLLEIVIEQYDFLYKKDQNFIVYGVSYETSVPMLEIFLETKNGEWFGIGEYSSNSEDALKFNSWWCSGKLDIDGIYTDSLNNR